MLLFSLVCMQAIPLPTTDEGGGSGMVILVVVILFLYYRSLQTNVQHLTEHLAAHAQPVLGRPGCPPADTAPQCAGELRYHLHVGPTHGTHASSINPMAPWGGRSHSVPHVWNACTGIFPLTETADRWACGSGEPPSAGPFCQRVRS